VLVSRTCERSSLPRLELEFPSPFRVIFPLVPSLVGLCTLGAAPAKRESELRCGVVGAALELARAVRRNTGNLWRDCVPALGQPTCGRGVLTRAALAREC
jgi:hypothetical protein